MKAASCAIALLLVTTVPGLAQDSISALRAICDQAAASPLDKTRPTNIPGVDPDKIDVKIAVPACEAAAKAAPNDPRIAFQLGRAYGAAKSYEAARAQYTRSDEIGYALASNNLAAMYADGLGGPPDQEKARELFEKSAFAGVAIAMKNLGQRNYDGKQIPKNWKEAHFFGICLPS